MHRVPLLYESQSIPVLVFNVIFKCQKHILSQIEVIEAAQLCLDFHCLIALLNHIHTSLKDCLFSALRYPVKNHLLELTHDRVLLKTFNRQVLESSMFPMVSEIVGKLASSHNFAPLLNNLA